MIGEIISIQTYGNSANSGIGTMLTPTYMYGNMVTMVTSRYRTMLIATYWNYASMNKLLNVIIVDRTQPTICAFGAWYGRAC